MLLPIHNPKPSFTRHDFVDHHAAEADDRVLVVIFLRGGADGLTLIPPFGDDGYYLARPSLGIRRDRLIDLNGYFGLNRALEALHRHFAEGDLAIWHGAGSEDETRSHFEAQDFMEHAGEGGGGWLARYLRARNEITSAPPAALSAVAIGTTLPESLRGAPAGAVMQSVRDFSFGGEDPRTPHVPRVPLIIEQLAKLYAVETGPLGQAARDTIEAVKKLREIRAGDDAPANNAIYPDTTFGRGLREIVRLIKADVGLVTTTIDLGGWDTHFVQAQLIDSLMTELATGVDAFLRDLGEERRRVTIVTMTEFGRRLRENTSFGTDHGAGSVMMVLSPHGAGALGGGKIRSGWTDLSPGHLDEVGDVPAAINYRDVLAPVLRKYSPAIDLARVFPGHMFSSASSASLR